MFTKHLQPRFPLWQYPLWQYLNQPLFCTELPLVLSPKRFWCAYQVELLERCWSTTCHSEGNFYS